MNRFFTLLLAASCLTAVGQVPDYVPTDGLVAWYPLSENGDDASENENDLIQVGAPNWTVDEFGAYCDFDGQGTHFYHPEASFPEVSELTISFWTRIDEFSTSNGVGSLRPLISKHYSTIEGSFILHPRSDGIRGTYADPHNIELHTWYHITCVFADVLKLYINGEQINQAESPTNGWNATDYPFMIGGWLNQPWWSNDWSDIALSFDGGMSSVGLWSRELNDNEITLLAHPVQGCMHVQACNFNQLATLDDGSCDFVSCHCLEGTIWSEELGGCVVANPSDSNFDGCVQLNDLLDLLSAYGDCAAEESLWQCGDPLEYQGYDYETVLIGEQCWFAENLRTENYRNGQALLTGVESLDWSTTIQGATSIYGEGAFSCTSESPDGDACDEEFALDHYGRLYNWFAASSNLGICPAGWHVPSDLDWLQLFDEAGGAQYGGHTLKASTGWKESGNGSDVFGFSVLPSGFRTNEGDNFSVAGVGAYLWSSTQVPSNGSDGFDGVSYQMLWSSNQISITSSRPRYGFAIRCIKD